jgi:hypothetical protein
MEYIAFDAHKRYTLASVARADGRLVREQRVPHERGALQQFLERCERGSPVAVETIGNWYWIVDEIEAAGCVPKLVHARKAKLMMGEINKTDKLGGVLEETGVARHEGRRGEAEHLPEGKVPRHHGKHGPERIEAQIAARGVRVAWLLGQEGVRVVRVVLADPGALVDLRLRLDDWLPHLEGHRAGVFGPARAQRRASVAPAQQRAQSASRETACAQTREHDRAPGWKFP